jgi:hypothetical protein
VEDPQPDEEDVDDKAKFKPLPSTVPEKEKEKGVSLRREWMKGLRNMRNTGRVGSGEFVLTAS